MKNKILNFLYLIIFIIIFSVFNSWEYINFHKENKNIIQEEKNLLNQIQEFNFDKIKILKDTKLYFSPDENILDIIIEEINNAKNKVYIEVYMLTETRIQNALKKAKQNNIDLKVILEKNPYMATSINNKAYDFLIKNNIDAIWSNTNNYSLNHSKIILIDNKAIISTWNFTYSSFKKNRELFIITNDEEIVSNLNKIFSNDFIWNKNIIYNNNIILSPNYSREKIEYIINNAQNSINMYFPYIQDESLENILINKAKNWLEINLIVDKVIEEDKAYNSLLKAWINIKKIKKNKLHAKAILVDNKYLYIWSINFSSSSLDKNREIWILINNKDIILKFTEIFESDK